MFMATNIGLNFPHFFKFLPWDLVMVFQSRKDGAKSSLKISDDNLIVKDQN